MAPLIELTQIVKTFGGVHALRGVDFALAPGSIHGLAGEKSGDAGIPKSVVTDGPVVTKANAPGMAWMEKHFLI